MIVIYQNRDINHLSIHLYSNHHLNKEFCLHHHVDFPSNTLHSNYHQDRFEFQNHLVISSTIILDSTLFHFSGTHYLLLFQLYMFIYQANPLKCRVLVFDACMQLVHFRLREAIRLDKHSPAVEVVPLPHLSLILQVLLPVQSVRHLNNFIYIVYFKFHILFMCY